MNALSRIVPRFRDVPQLLAASCTVALVIGCGGGQLNELPFADAGIARRGLQRTVATDSRDVWFLHRNPLAGTGAPASLAHWNGETLTAVTLPDNSAASTIAVAGPNEVITGGTAVLYVMGTQVTDITMQTSGAASFRVASRGDGTVYAVGNGVLMRRTPGAAAFEPLPSPVGGMNELVVVAPNQIVATGDGNGTLADVIYFFNGVAWTLSSPMHSARRLAASALDDVWAVPTTPRAGAPLEVSHYNGTGWTAVSTLVAAEVRGGITPTLTLQGIVSIGTGRAGAVVVRSYASIPPRSELVWVTGDRNGLRTAQMVRVFCTTSMCADGDFSGTPILTSDGVLFVGPYYGTVSTRQ